MSAAVTVDPSREPLSFVSITSSPPCLVGTTTELEPAIGSLEPRDEYLPPVVSDAGHALSRRKFDGQNKSKLAKKVARNREKQELKNYRSVPNQKGDLWYLNAAEESCCVAAAESAGDSLEKIARNPGGGAPSATVHGGGTERWRWR